MKSCGVLHYLQWTTIGGDGVVEVLRDPLTALLTFLLSSSIVMKSIYSNEPKIHKR